jgi:peroxiredoxin
MNVDDMCLLTAKGAAVASALCNFSCPSKESMQVACIIVAGYAETPGHAAERIAMTPQSVPDATFHTRVRNEGSGGPNPFEWRTLTSDDVFAGKRIVLFALPGAFTPACSEDHLPGYEQHHDAFRALGVDEVICLAVNDAFVMFQWAVSREIKKVFMLPDGNAEFTRKMGMLVERTSNGMGMRSWRYSMLVNDRKIEKLFVEADFKDNPSGVPLGVSGAETMLDFLRES